MLALFFGLVLAPIRAVPPVATLGRLQSLLLL
jgi:hypothetical protein